MKRPIALTHEFVTVIPDEVEERTLYVSMDYATAVHKCCCGCGREVVTPLTPTDWTLIYDGVSISLDPSVGSWGLDCRSHYWIDKSTVRWAQNWSSSEVNAARSRDRRLKAIYYGESEPVAQLADGPIRRGLIKRFRRWMSKCRRS